MTTESKPVRYFDHELQAWVTVLPTATAAGAHTVDQLRPMNAAGWLAGKSAAKAKNPGLHRRSGRDLQRAAKAGVDDLLFDRLRIADAYVRTRPYVTATGLGNAAVRGRTSPPTEHRQARNRRPACRDIGATRFAPAPTGRQFSGDRGIESASARCQAVKPWHATPLPDLQRSIHYIRLAVRALPDRDLASELAELAAMAAKQPDELGIETMCEIYRREQQRRADPTRAFDTELDVLLSRIGRQSIEADRRRLREIGEELSRLGGREALSAAHRRVMDRASDKQKALFDHILGKWWGRIAAVRRVTAAEIDAKKTTAGGWTRADLAEWGVGWPPPKGWREALIQGHQPGRGTV